MNGHNKRLRRRSAASCVTRETPWNTHRTIATRRISKLKAIQWDPVRSCAKYCYTFIWIIFCFLLLLLGHAQWVRFCGGNLWLVLSTHVLLYSAVLMRKNFSPAVWNRQENVPATSCSLFSSPSFSCVQLGDEN